MQHYKEIVKSGEKFLIIVDEAHRYRNEYTEDYALLHDLCCAPFNVALNAHTHRYAFYPKGSVGNNFPVFVGGGYSLNDATVMVLTKKGSRMSIKVLDTKGKVLKEMEL